MTFVITAKFVITSICSAQKISGSYIVSLIFPCYSSEKHMLCVFVRIALLRHKYTKRMIYKKKCSKVSVTDALDGSYQVSL